MKHIVKASLRSSLIMLSFVVVGTALLAITFSKTRILIAESEEKEKLALINQILPSSEFDNNLMQDTLRLGTNNLLGNAEPTLVYRARRQGKPVAAVMEATAPDGYNGKIKLLLAIRANGEVAGVRVISHNETPGLGDYIEIAKNPDPSKRPWITIFERQALGPNHAQEWQVKKDGGKFDYMAGATITPRAIVKAVHKALLFFNEYKTYIFTQSKPELDKDMK